MGIRGEGEFENRRQESLGTQKRAQKILKKKIYLEVYKKCVLKTLRSE